MRLISRYQNTGNPNPQMIVAFVRSVALRFRIANAFVCLSVPVDRGVRLRHTECAACVGVVGHREIEVRSIPQIV